MATLWSTQRDEAWNGMLVAKILNAGMPMRSATLKALAIHTADEAGDHPGPDYRFGWGVLNTKNAVELIAGDGNGHRILEESLANNETYILEVIADGGASLKATLVWTDPPGTVFDDNPPIINRADPQLVNDLDMVILRGEEVFLPWTLDPAQPEAPAATGVNSIDNVEQVEISNPGFHTYLIQITHKGSLYDPLSVGEGTQSFSLIVSGNAVTPPCANQPISLLHQNWSHGHTIICSNQSISVASSTLNTGAGLTLHAPHIDLGDGFHIQSHAYLRAHWSSTPEALSSPALFSETTDPLGLTALSSGV